MESHRKKIVRRYFRKVVIYFLTYCLVLNVSLPVALSTPTPSGGGFTVGTGTITQDGNATNVIVDQVQSVIEWSSLDTAGGAPEVRESLNFSQGGLSNSAVLNRVSGAATQFNGDLNAAGMRIFIVNPAGVVFGSGSTVNVAQLVASGLRMTNTNFLNTTGDPTQKMVFSSGSGDVTNNGTITATNSVYLVGEDVTNNGAILCPDGLVVMAAGDATLRLGQPGSSVIVDIIAGDLNADGSNDLSNNGTVGEGGSPVGELVLASGDVFSQAIANIRDLAVVANENVEFNGDIDGTGDVEVYSGLGNRGRLKVVLGVDGSITAGSIKLQAGDPKAVLNRRNDLNVTGELHSTVGDVTVSAREHIEIDDNITADEGSIYVTADSDGLGRGNLSTKSLNAPNGDINIKGRIVDVDGNGVAGGNMTIRGMRNWGLEGGGIVHAAGSLQAGGNIDISVRENLSNDIIDGSGQITLDGDAIAGGDLILNNDTDMTASVATLQAGNDVIFANSDYPTEAYNGDCDELNGIQNLTIRAGVDPSVATGKIYAENTTITVKDSSLTLEQDVDLNLDDFLFGGQGDTDLTLISNNGSVTAVETGVNPANAADQWASVGATANTGIILSGDQGNIVTKRLTSATGDIDVNSKAGQILAIEAIEATAGSVILTAADGIDADGDITAGANINLNSSTTAAGDLLAGSDIIINEDLTLNGGDWVLNDTEWSWQDGDQSIVAETGTITAESWIWKETPGEIHMCGGDPELAIDLRHQGDLDEEDAAVATAGNLYVVGNGDVQISGDLTALGGEYWASPDWPEIEESEVVIEPVAVGGVSIVSENGRIYTEDGIDNDTINIVIEGYSDQTEGSVGVDLPYDEGKAAIVLVSNGDLKLGENAGLLAVGLYDAAVADDRSAVDFLDEPEEIGGLLRNEGDPIDVAIYLASTTGNIHVGSPVSIEGGGAGAVVVDAYDTVSFGSLFEESLEGIGWLEVCSRRTGSLNEAVVYGTLPYADGSGPEDRYVLRGEDGLGISRAWVLDAIPPLVMPDFAETPKGIPVVGLDILNNDDAGEFPPVTVTLDSPTSEHGGTLTLNPDGTVTYEPPADLSGLSFDENGYAIDTFTYSITDAGKVTSETTMVTITLINELPTPIVDEAITNHGAPVVIPVLLNDSDPDADPLAVGSFSYQGTGTLVLNNDDTFTYTPAKDFVGVDSFTYLATDGFNDSLETTVTITVSPPQVLLPAVAVPYIHPAPGLQREVIEVSGCPALVKWVASELDTDESKIQIWIANASASGRDIQPCDACAKLKEAATILQDVDGARLAALAQVISQFASSDALPTEEQMASIANAIANDIEGNGRYAAAGEYLNALVEYIGVLTDEMGFSAEEAIQLAMENYIQNLVEDENMGVAAFVAARLVALGGSQELDKDISL